MLFIYLWIDLLIALLEDLKTWLGSIVVMGCRFYKVACRQDLSD